MTPPPRPPISARDRLILDALSHDGAKPSGPLPDLDGLARWLDHVNHDGTTAAELERDLARLAAAGWLDLLGSGPLTLHFRLKSHAG